MIGKNYKLRGITLDQLVEEIQTCFTHLAADESLEQSFEREDIDFESLRSEIRQADGQCPIEVKPTGSSLDPETIEVLVTFGPLISIGAEIIRDLWRHVILPRILDRHGVDAVKDVYNED